MGLKGRWRLFGRLREDVIGQFAPIAAEETLLTLMQGRAHPRVGKRSTSGKHFIAPST